MLRNLHIIIQVSVVLLFVLFSWGIGLWPLDDSFAFGLDNSGWFWESVKNAFQTILLGLAIWTILIFPMWLAVKFQKKTMNSKVILFWPIGVVMIMGIVNGIRFYVYRPYI